ncbi:MAG: hypothetical protein ACI9OJ_005804 [Myxococcota bacterium]|jgi:hypothetical protein
MLNGVPYLTALCGTLLILSWPASSRAAAPTDALLVVGVDPQLEAELADDVTEAVSFAIGDAAPGRTFNFFSKERIKAELDYRGPRKSGGCIFDNECLRRAHQRLRTATFVLGRIKRVPAGYHIVLTRIDLDRRLDVTRQATTPKSPAALINKVRALLVESLSEAPASLLLRISESDAVVAIGGRAVPKGIREIEVEPGMHHVSIIKPGFVDFSVDIPCRAAERCVLSATLQKEPEPVDPALSTGLIAGGWSAVGVGVVLSTVGIVYGLRAQSIDDELASECSGAVCQGHRTDAESRAAEGQQATRIFNGAGITGMVLVVSGVATAIAGHALSVDVESDVHISTTLISGGAYFNASFEF